MNIITLYICEKCHAKYDSEEECKQCENSHRSAKKICNEVFEKSSGPFNYPDTIKVKMSDGKVVCYSRR